MNVKADCEGFEVKPEQSRIVIGQPEAHLVLNEEYC
jgi:hypothetical protein